MHPFEEYLKSHNLEALQVSVIGKVRYMTVYNAMKGLPITPEHAKKIRHAVLNMTGVPYQGPFALNEPELEDAPTLPIKKIPRTHFH